MTFLNHATRTPSIHIRFGLLSLITLLSFLGNSQEWDHQLEGQVIRSYAINPWNTDILLIGTKSFAGDGRVYISMDAGNSWMATNNNKPLSDSTEDVQCLAFLNDSTVLAGCWKTGLYMSHDLGKNFSKMNDFPASDIRAITVEENNQSNLWLATTTHGVIRSEDGLKSWIMQSGEKQSAWDIEFDHSKPNTLYACLYSGELGKSKDNGNSFRPIQKSKEGMYYDVLVHFDGRTWAVGGGDSTQLYLYRGFNGSGWSKPLDKQEDHIKANYSCVHEVNGTIYLGSWDKGLMMMKDNQWKVVPEVDAMTITKIDYANNFLYVFTWGNGVYRQKHIYDSEMTFGDSLDLQKKKGWFWELHTNRGIRELEIKVSTEEKTVLYSSTGSTDLRKIGDEMRKQFLKNVPESGILNYHCSITFKDGTWKQYDGTVTLPEPKKK